MSDAAGPENIRCSIFGADNVGVCTYSEARQQLASVLDAAEESGKVLIRRQDGRVFALIPENEKQKLPLDIPSIDKSIGVKAIVKLVRQKRSRSARG